MSMITELRPGRGREKWVNVFLNDKFAFSLRAEAVLSEGLQVGQELSADQVEALERSERFSRCLDAAARYLGYRPRSESEVREKLKRRGFGDDCIGAALTKLKGQGLMDDVAFAQFWKDNRESFSPRSQQLIKQELRRKGVSSKIVDQAGETVDDSDGAYRAALVKARRLPLSDYPTFRRRLGEYLRRRGFSYDVILRTVEVVWRERGAQQLK